MSKRTADNGNLPQGKHRPTGFNPEWGNNFPFVLYAGDASGAGGMFCSAVEAKPEKALCKLWCRVHKQLL